MDNVPLKNNSPCSLTWPSLIFLLVICVTFLIKPLMFLYVFSGPIESDRLTKFFIMSETAILGKFSMYKSVTDSEFYLERIHQLQGQIITSYYTEHRDAALLWEYLQPSMLLLSESSQASDAEIGKMSLFMAAVSACRDDATSVESYIAEAVTRGVYVTRSVEPLNPCY